MTRAAALRGDGGLALKRAVESCIALEKRHISQFGYCHWMHPLREISVASVDFRSEAVTPNAWMSPELQRFYRHIERKHKLDNLLASVDRNSVFGRRLKIEQELELIKQDSDLTENRERKADLEKKNAAKDPWASRRLF